MAVKINDGVFNPKIVVHGVDTTMKILNRIPPDLRNKVLKKALRDSGKILRDSIVSYAPVTRNKTRVRARSYSSRKRFGTRFKKLTIQREGGILVKALKATKAILLKKSYSGYPIVWVGPTWRKYGRPWNAWYAHFAEFGTKFYKRRPRGWGFMKKGLDAAETKCTNEISKQVYKYIKKING